MQQDKNQQGGAVAGYPVDDDVITGATIKSDRGITKSRVNTVGGGQRVGKNKSKNKGQVSQRTSTSDVVASSNDKLGSKSTPESRQALINRIKSLPDSMMPAFVKKYADIIVNRFKLDTPEKVANFFGQTVSEGTRSTSEGIYYTTGKRLKEVFKSRVKPAHQKNFIYSDDNVDRFKNYGYPTGIPTPWQVGGWPDLYYGSRNGNDGTGVVSPALNDFKNIRPDQKVPRLSGRGFDAYYNPFHYKGSSEGYAYRGHGIIQLTGKGKYERMNELFGVNGKYEKNNIDFVKNPERVAYDWGNRNEATKWAVLGSLVFWEDKPKLNVNKVSLETTKQITRIVRGASEGYQYRHTDTIKFYNFLKSGTTVQNSSSSSYKQQVIVKVSTSKIKFIGGSDRKLRTGAQAKNDFGLVNFANLSFFESNGRPTPPYKSDGYVDTRNPNGWRVFTISNDNIARIYSASEMTPSVWANTKYACGGSPGLLDKNGQPFSEQYFKAPYTVNGQLGNQGKNFLRLTGRTAIGILPGGREVIIFVLRNSKMGNLSSVISSYGCTSAINFDGGGSTFAWEGGNLTIPSPDGTNGRPVSTFLSWG
jgi:predicted chitinase